MKNILILGAGKSATVLIDYLLEQAAILDFTVTLGDLDAELAAQKLTAIAGEKGFILIRRTIVFAKNVLLKLILWCRCCLHFYILLWRKIVCD
jgi:hypothetical protein